MPLSELPKPLCPLGYPADQVEGIFGSEDELVKFWEWLDGQTMAICDGRLYNHDLGRYEDTECVGSAHGLVVYPWDLERYWRQKK